MKNYTLSLLICLLAFSGFAQKTSERPTCLSQYQQAFNKRGAYPIEDGIHRDVYIFVEESSKSYCVRGKTRVENNQVVAIYLKRKGGQYDVYDASKFKSLKIAKINYGTAQSLTTTDNKKLSVIFYRKLRPRKQSFAIASFMHKDLDLNSDTLSCVEAFKIAFSNRGVFPIADGEHRDVIVEFIEGKKEPICVKGMARVENNEVTAIYLKYPDGTYEVYEGDEFVLSKKAKIKDGISIALNTTDALQLRVIFNKKIKPKRKKFQNAIIKLDSSYLDLNMTSLASYQKAFYRRGASPVEDGIHREVSVFVKQKTKKDLCVIGKVRVANNLVEAVYLRYNDGKYKLYESDKFIGKKRAIVKNGISEELKTSDGKFLTVIFNHKLKPEKPKYDKFNYKPVLVKGKELNCLEDYRVKFEERGSKSIENGIHRDVLIQVEDKYDTLCLHGKARIESSLIVSIYLKLEDGKFELYDEDRFTRKKKASFKKGISDTLSSNDGKKLTVIFHTKLRPKKEEYEEVILPDLDDL